VAIQLPYYVLSSGSERRSSKEETHLVFSEAKRLPRKRAVSGPTQGQQNPSFGSGKFASHEDIDKGEYVKDNTMFIKVTVDCDGFSEP